MGQHTAVVKLENKTGRTITDINFLHRYDEDVYNTGSLGSLDNYGQTKIGEATFWIGFLRTGKDYWWIQYRLDGQLWTCKANFYCTLTSADAENGGDVVLVLEDSKMKVILPISSGCEVMIYESDALHDIVTQAHKNNTTTDL